MKTSGPRSTRRSVEHSPRQPTRPSASCSGAGSTSRPRRPNCCERSSELPMSPLDPELDVAVVAMIGARARNDLLGLAEVHGELPLEPIPGLDS